MRKIRHFNRFHDHRRHGTITVVSDVVYENDVPARIEFGVAYCSPRDVFRKKDGVGLATARLDQKDENFSEVIPIKSRRPLHYYEAQDLILSHIGNAMNSPRWARKLIHNT